MEQPDSHRNKWALGLSITLSAFIFVGFAFYKGYLDLGSGKVADVQTPREVAAVAIAEEAPSPIDNTKKTFEAAFIEIDRKYKELKKSVNDVMVPFVTGIEVYERE